jgi:hypothetical protein
VPIGQKSLPVEGSPPLGDGLGGTAVDDAAPSGGAEAGPSPALPEELPSLPVPAPSSGLPTQGPPSAEASSQPLVGLHPYADPLLSASLVVLF